MKRRTILWIALLASLVSVFSCCWFIVELARVVDLREELIYSEEAVYAIDSQIILQSLARGEVDVFTWIGGDVLTAQTTIGLPPVQWGQDEYWRIVQAFYSIVRKESLEEWYIKEISFTLDCIEVSFGPQYAYFYFFMYADDRDDNELRLEHYIGIAPQENEIDWSHDEWLSPFKRSYEAIDLAQVTITAEEALRIAEENGGLEARISVDNDCDLSISLIAGLRNDDWNVWYSDSNLDELFVVNIDEQTGSYKITYPETE